MTDTEVIVSCNDVEQLRPLQAVDFLLGPEEFVSRCVAAHKGAAAMLTLAQRAALAEAIRGGRPRLEVVDAVASYSVHGRIPFRTSNGHSNVGDLIGHIVTDQLSEFAPNDDEAFLEQVYRQALNRSPTSIEAVEAKFDLKSGLSRVKFIERIARRSPACRLDTDALPVGLGSGISEGGKICYRFIEPSRSGGWSVASDVYLQPATTVDGFLQLEPGLVLLGPKASFPAGKWYLTIDLVQPECAHLTVEIVANGGLDLLTGFDLAGPAQLVLAFTIEPENRFLEVRLHKSPEPSHLRQMKLRELTLRQV